MLALGFVLFACGWIGGGDAKLVAATALWLGWSPLFEYALLASVLGGFLTLGLVIVRGWPLPLLLETESWAVRLHAAKTGIPYGIALSASGLLLYPELPLVQLLLN